MIFAHPFLLAAIHPYLSLQYVDQNVIYMPRTHTLSPLPPPPPPADVEQTDIHMPRTTVHEALQISGLLRLHNTSRAVVEKFVNEVRRARGGR